jgi:hypothetical protein
VAFSAKQGTYRYVETLSAIFADTPYSGPSVVDVGLFQFFMAFGANQFSTLAEILFDVHVTALDVFYQRALLNVKRFAVGAAIVD